VVDKTGNLAWTTFGRYALLEKIGAGGMAEIYRAKTFGAAGFEKEFAVKMILPALADDKEFVGMFINEAKIAVSLYHANIVQVFDLGEMDAQYYIAMEFVHGKDLLDVLARCAQLDLKIPFNIVLHIAMEFLKGLDFAHRAKNSYGEDLNIIHRDVSPSNVLMSYSGDVKIGDFGVAKAAVQRNMTESGTLKGKVGYMSPEQVIGEDIDSRSDVFSAGIVFLEAISMQRLFIGNSDLDVMLRVRDADIEEALQNAGPLPQQLIDIIRKSMAKHREERFQTAGEFYQAIMDFCYQHRIKVTGSDLSNFMRRLFAAEIDREKTRRISEERDGGKHRAAVLAGERQRMETPPPLEAVRAPKRPKTVPPMPSIVSADSFDEEDIDEFVDKVQATTRYRYRDEAGLVFGPMGQKTLLRIVTDRPPESADRISADGGGWQHPEDFDFLAVHLKHPAGNASKSVPVGAAVYKPSKLKSHGDEDPLLSAIGRELGDRSSPVMDQAPDLLMQNAQEAKEAIHNMRGQYSSYDGDLKTAPFARLLARLHRGKATGRICVQRGDIEKSIYLDHGEPILIDSNREEELLGYFLISRKIITQDQLEEGLARLNEWGGRLGDALVAIGAIPAHEVFRHLSEQMREKLLDVFTWDVGNYGYFENQQPTTHGYPLGIDAYSTIVEGCMQRVPIERIRANSNAYRYLTVRIHENPVDLDHLKLPTKALRVINLYEPGDALDRLLSKMPHSDSDFVQRVFYLLVQVEYFALDGETSPNLPG